MNKYKEEGLNFPSEQGDSKNVEKNNLIMLLIFCMLKKKIYTPLLSKHNSKNKILLMIPNGEGWHYLSLKKYLYYLEE